MGLGLWLKWGTSALLIALLLFAAVSLRMASLGEAEMQTSEDAFDQGKVDKALAHARIAAGFYTPGATHIKSAHERMIAIALGAEQRGELELAMQGWRALRGALLEIRHAWVPNAQLLKLANDHLARLQSQGATDPVALRSELHSALERRETPGVGGVMFLSVGFALSALGLSTFLLSGISKDGVLIFERARWSLLLTALGLACWALAVIRA